MSPIDVIRSRSRSLKLIFSVPTWPVVILLAIAAIMQASEVHHSAQVDLSDLDLLRNYYLNDLLQPHNYAPGKNSFLFQTLHPGQRKTVLDLTGSGSVRHLWSTWSIHGSDAVPTGRILLRIYVDKKPTPAIVGTVDQLCRAAEATGTRFVPFPAFNYKDAYNFYLPIYFKYGIKIEVEALDEIGEFYTQIDYRLAPNEEHSTGLVSESTKAGLVLKYSGEARLSLSTRKLKQIPQAHVGKDLRCGPTGDCHFTIVGPGVLRKLSILGDPPSDLELAIYWDDDTNPGVQAPIKYFFADFVNAAMESKPGERTCYFPMPFRHKARIVLRSGSNSPAHITIGYAIERRAISSKIPYFHAAYHEMQETLGYSQYPVLQIHGKGLFVGLNLFDSGHNHGGGDAALIDAGTAHPRVLHGICGEDYFAFAWHHTGTMTPLTGAPVHERRYRLHLENPYPFSESFQFLFGVFANLHPRSVAFWYQVPEPLRHGQWVSFDTPWKVLGPLGPETSLPDSVNDQSYETIVAINNPTKLTVRWQDVQMTSGFLDLTYQFRHYVLVEKGSGFVAGADRTELTTYIYSPAKRDVGAILGHDDEVLVRLNGATISNLPGHSGFYPSPLRIPLRSGWNTFNITLSNEENVNWRWSGLSLAFRRGQNQSQGLRFSSITSVTCRRASNRY